MPIEINSETAPLLFDRGREGLAGHHFQNLRLALGKEGVEMKI
jgi:hypothetical protein